MAKKSKKRTKKKMKISFKLLLVVLLILSVSIIYLPTAFLLAIGMLPTLVAYIVDNDPGKNKSFTIGAMNFAGCFPFLLGVWKSGDPFYQVVNYLVSPSTIIIIYGAALMGYIINWAVTLAVSSILVHRSKMRINKIEKQKESLEERWGTKVNGSFTLDEYGFPIEAIEKDN
jgi:general stress protein CsbA